jgi:HEAT repeat protein
VKRPRARWWGIGAGCLLAGLVFFLPGSPLNLPDLTGLTGLPDGRSPRSWVRDLTNPDVDTRSKACFALGEIGPAAEQAVPALAEALVQDPSPRVRAGAALALTKMVPASRAAVEALARALDQDDEPLVRLNSALALLRLKEEARPAIPALIRALHDERNQTNAEMFPFTIQEAAALALGHASTGNDEALEALTSVLKSSEGQALRRAVVRALGAVGPPAEAVAPLLRPLLASGPDDLRQAARETLQSIGAAELGPSAAAEGNKPLELAGSERQYLWEIEHHGNLLVKHGFAALAGALARGDSEALGRLLAGDFRGSDLDRPLRVRSSTPYARAERLQDSGRPALPLDRAAFLARLLRLRHLFSYRPPQVKLALMTLSPCRRGQLDGAWEGTAQLRLHGEHAPGAPAEIVVVLGYRVDRPSKDNLSRPGWLHRAALRQVLIATAPRYLFAEVARQRGLDPTGLHDNWTSPSLVTTPGGVYVCDFNRDGILDVLITDLARCALYRGRPDGTFEDVTVACGLPRSIGRPTAAWVDVDGDGWEDLFLDGRVFRNEAGRFVDYTERCNLRIPGDVLGVVVADYDRDGKLDLYLTRAGQPGLASWLDGKRGDGRGNQLFRNRGGWQFEDVTKRSGAGAGRGSTFSAAWLDANNDGWPDLHVINEFGDGVLLVNQRNGTFSPHRLASHPADFGSMGVTVGDVDNDGNIDIYCANMYSKAGTRVIGNLSPDAYPGRVMEKMRRFVAGSQLHLNRGGLKFEQAGVQRQVAGVGWAYGACLADLDNDGWLDLYATAGFISRDRNEPDG